VRDDGEELILHAALLFRQLLVQTLLLELVSSFEQQRLLPDDAF
jgi:hypothetical protein